MIDKNLNNIFSKEKFVDYETAIKNRDILIRNILLEVENNGKDEIDLLTILYTKVFINEKDKKGVKKYFVGIKIFPPNTMDKLASFDSSLITYYMNKFKDKEPVIRFITGSSQEAKFLKTFSEEEIIKHCDLLVAKGDIISAKKIQNTWELAQTNTKFEEIEYTN